MLIMCLGRPLAIIEFLPIKSNPDADELGIVISERS